MPKPRLHIAKFFTQRVTTWYALPKVVENSRSNTRLAVKFYIYLGPNFQAPPAVTISPLLQYLPPAMCCSSPFLIIIPQVISSSASVTCLKLINFLWEVSSPTTTFQGSQNLRLQQPTVENTVLSRNKSDWLQSQVTSQPPLVTLFSLMESNAISAEIYSQYT